MNFIVIANYVLPCHCEGAKRLRQSHPLIPALFIFIFEFLQKTKNFIFTNVPILQSGNLIGDSYQKLAFLLQIPR